jgi:hypothetical protein
MPLKGPLLALGLAAVASVATSAPTTNEHSSASAPRQHKPAWTEVKWPFLLDQWGTGRAFHCRAADCGQELTVYLRPKIGFCNCTTGVADDAELDRVGDVELISQRFAPLGDGHPITVGWMNGRSRSYSAELPNNGRRPALALAFNDKCDVVVATLVGDRELAAGAEGFAVAFLNSTPVLRWVEVSLGL